MQLKQFSSVMENLKSAYGEKLYPDPRVEIIWNQVESLDFYWFDKLVKAWIGSNLKPILVDQIREAAREERNKKFDSQWQNPILSPMPRNNSCDECRDIGLLWKINDEGYEYVYRCQCRSGLARESNIPFLNA